MQTIDRTEGVTLTESVQIANGLLDDLGRTRQDVTWLVLVKAIHEGRKAAARAENEAHDAGWDEGYNQGHEAGVSKGSIETRYAAIDALNNL